MRAVLTALSFVCLATFARSETQSVEEQLTHSRAVQAAIWGMPAVNTDLMRQEMLTKTPGKVNQFIYWGGPLDWHNQTLTPNPDTLYFMGFFDVKDGPMVLEVPPGDANGSLNGNIVTQWQTSLEDVGLLGVDKGRGGKFVLLPPGYADQVPEAYSPLRSDTYGGYALIRSNLKSHSEADVAASIAYAKRVKFYPLSAAANPPETVFTDVKDVNFDSTIRYDVSFYEKLDGIIQSEPWIDRDRAMIDPLRTIGIEKGKPFAPDEAARAILNTAIGEAKQLLAARYDVGFPAFWEGSHWTLPALPEAIEGQGTTYADKSKYAVDARGLGYTYAYISIKRLGAGQFYLISIRDKDGNGYDGAKTYRLHVPPDVPVDQYWSLTAYDRETHALIKNVDRASRASNTKELRRNPDGSVDLYIGSKAPVGQESNWIPTDPARKFEFMFRLYGPKPEFFEKKTWKLPDVEKVSV
ncbi:DUF1254 domain-containing protein [Rhizobium vallis]|uniref:DUF1254 domain-containing protein n=1 Tax=Rhizobium vallis TaxID=634290 RepID=A0A432PGA7_9HYPH|nr:DUF1254 domain-containing protein [Rhizobium vallis]RUM23342.1 DUF1254 domain-containing protein [Rhizobium vallis]